MTSFYFSLQFHQRLTGSSKNFLLLLSHSITTGRPPAMRGYLFLLSFSFITSIGFYHNIRKKLFRTFIYPLQMKSARGTPWFISLSAHFFCIWNGYIQGAWHAKYATWSNFFGNPLTYLGFFSQLSKNNSY